MTIATDMLAKYLAAETELLEGKSVAFAGRQLTMENLSEIREGRQEWERRVAAENAPSAPRFAGLGYSVARFDQE
ncbi:hypothetical protein [Variovorax sp. DAIF25]|jgi:hypothetical protein|uniref:hypothetical protein n=1 Tax=Variovorax sp. DAIF25 TaxID=3080983 RepID=UPI003D6A49D1